MNGQREKPSFVERYLDPSERLGEILFGLIMVLTFTLTAGLTLEESGARELLIAALGCNIAWGIIDGGMYIMGAMMARSRQSRTLRNIQQAASDEAAFHIIDKALEDTVADYTSPEEKQRIRQDILALARRAPVKRVRVTREDVMGAIAVFWLVVVTCFPAIVPFLFIHDARLALRVSNALLVAMLFVIGYQWGRHAHTSRWIAGTVFLVLGLVLVLLAIALGG